MLKEFERSFQRAKVDMVSLNIFDESSDSFATNCDIKLDSNLPNLNDDENEDDCETDHDNQHYINDFKALV